MKSVSKTPTDITERLTAIDTSRNRCWSAYLLSQHNIDMRMYGVRAIRPNSQMEYMGESVLVCHNTSAPHKVILLWSKEFSARRLDQTSANKILHAWCHALYAEIIYPGFRKAAKTGVPDGLEHDAIRYPLANGSVWWMNVGDRHMLVSEIYI